MIYANGRTYDQNELRILTNNEISDRALGFICLFLVFNVISVNVVTSSAIFGFALQSSNDLYAPQTSSMSSPVVVLIISCK